MKNNISFDSSLSKFGIGLFETIKIEDKPIYFDLHMDRLYTSVNTLDIKVNIDRKSLEKEILTYIRDNNIKNKALRVTLFDEGYNISIRDIIYKDEMYKDGFKLTISPIKRGDSIIYRHKTTNYFENIYTKEYATKNGFNDAIFLSTDENDAGHEMIVYIDNIELKSNLNALESANLLTGKTFYDFNHINRQWEHTVYTSKELIDISFKKSNMNQYSLYNPPEFLHKLIKSEGYPNFNNPYVIYDTMSTLETNIKVLRFSTYGNIVRDCGQLLMLNARK